MVKIQIVQTNLQIVHSNLQITEIYAVLLFRLLWYCHKVLNIFEELEGFDDFNNSDYWYSLLGKLELNKLNKSLILK